MDSNNHEPVTVRLAKTAARNGWLISRQFALGHLHIRVRISRRRFELAIEDTEPDGDATRQSAA